MRRGPLVRHIEGECAAPAGAVSSIGVIEKSFSVTDIGAAEPAASSDEPSRHVGISPQPTAEAATTAIAAKTPRRLVHLFID